MKLQPVNDRIIIRALAPEERTQGGIIIAGTAQEKQQKAEVIAVGPGRMLDNGERLPLPVKVGDFLYTTKYGGAELKSDNETYQVITDADILAIEVN